MQLTGYKKGKKRKGSHAQYSNCSWLIVTFWIIYLEFDVLLFCTSAGKSIGGTICI
jgi:hypothetical protein